MGSCWDIMAKIDLIEIEERILEIKKVMKKQIITLFFITILTLFFHFLLICLNKMLDLQTTTSILLNFFTSGYGLLGTTIAFFLALALLIKYFLMDDFDIFSLNDNSRIISSLKKDINKKICLNNSISYTGYIIQSEKHSILDNFPITVYFAFLISSIIFFSVTSNFYNNLISSFPMKYSVQKFVETDQFHNFYSINKNLDLKRLSNLKTLPNINNENNDYILLDETINILNYSNDFLNLNVSKESDVYKSERYIYYYDLATKYSSLSKQIETAWLNKDLELFNKSVEELKILYIENEQY